MQSEVTFDEVGDEQIDVVYELALIAQIDKGRANGRLSESWRKRLDRTADGYMVRYGLPGPDGARPEKWFATLEEAKDWTVASAPRPMRVGGDVRWVQPS